MRYKSFCCENYTLEENPDNPTYEICSICGWKNDSIQNENDEYRGGANVISLKEAKKLYKNGK